MSVHILLSISALHWHNVTTRWAPTSASAMQDILMLTPAIPELIVQVSMTVVITDYTCSETTF